MYRFLYFKNGASGYTLCHLENCFFLLCACFKILTPKSLVTPINWNIEKNTNLNTKGLKRGTNLKNKYENDTDLPFYLAFPIGIYLFKINNKNRKTLCEICSKLKRKEPDQTCETKFLQVCSFSIILTSLQSLNLLYPLLFYVISTAILKFPP